MKTLTTPGTVSYIFHLHGVTKSTKTRCIRNVEQHNLHILLHVLTCTEANRGTNKCTAVGESSHESHDLNLESGHVS
jgi:hypothetical protein